MRILHLLASDYKKVQTVCATEKIQVNLFLSAARLAEVN